MAESAPPADEITAGERLLDPDSQPALGERVLDPELRLQKGRELAWLALDRRDHTTSELRRLLAGKRVEPIVIEQVVGELCEQGYLDDARFAQRFAEDKRTLESWGAERIRRKLASAGLPRELIDDVVGDRDGVREMQAALEILARRFPQPPQTPRERDRMVGVLIRKGYNPELAYDAVRRHSGAGEFD